MRALQYSDESLHTHRVFPTLSLTYVNWILQPRMMGPEIQVSWPTFALGYLSVDPPSIHPAIRHPARGIFQHLGFCQSSCWSEPFVIRIQTFCDQDPDPNQLCDPDPDQKVCDPDPDKTHLWSGSKPFVIRIRTFCDPNPNLLYPDPDQFRNTGFSQSLRQSFNLWPFSCIQLTFLIV